MTVSEQSRVATTAGKPDRAASRRWSVRGWADALRVYRQPRLIAILFMGFSSGLPLALTFGTLSYWLAEIGVSLTAIGETLSEFATKVVLGSIVSVKFTAVASAPPVFVITTV